MPRHKIRRRIGFRPKIVFFKPQGIPLRMLEEIMIEEDELEALKLYEVDDLDQTQAAEKMGVSQPTFARILDSANKKMARALIKGKAIRINVG